MNYLGEREQSVILDGIKSFSKPVLSGVPQGSILGPILFVLFINDLPQGISEDTHLALYADDTKIWRLIRNEEDIVQLQKDINNLHMWSINNKMMFHPYKLGNIQEFRPTRGSFCGGFCGSFCGSYCEFRGSFCEFHGSFCGSLAETSAVHSRKFARNFESISLKLNSLMESN